MNTYRKAIITTITVALMATGMVGAQGTREGEPLTEIEPPIVVEQSTQVDSSFEDDMFFMREEEKLARDVYLTLYDVWGLRTFSNIARAEQKHMDAVAYLLDLNNIVDPVKDAAVGFFTNKEIDALYNQLIEQGSISIVEALKVGAFIEDLDIADLERTIAGTTDNEAIRVYENLLRGSENHMRSFIYQLSRYNQTYTPTYISEQRFSEILN